MSKPYSKLAWQGKVKNFRNWIAWLQGMDKYDHVLLRDIIRFYNA